MAHPLLALCCWLALLVLPVRAAEPVPLPALQTRVTDLTATLDATQRGRLEARLAAIDRAGRAQVAVLLLPSTEPETIEQFGIRLAEAWKIGRKGADDGLIIIVAKNDHRMRIEVGYGLEGRIPDAIASRIVNERMAPAFRQGDFFGGLDAAIVAVDQALGGTAEAAPPAADPVAATAGAMRGDWIEWLFMLAMGAGVLRAIFGLLGSLAAAALGGWLGFMVFGSTGIALVAGVVVFLLSFVSLAGGGRGGGFGGGMSGGGGFSGGGGGASGRW